MLWSDRINEFRQQANNNSKVRNSSFYFVHREKKIIFKDTDKQQISSGERRRRRSSSSVISGLKREKKRRNKSEWDREASTLFLQNREVQHHHDDNGYRKANNCSHIGRPFNCSHSTSFVFNDRNQHQWYQAAVQVSSLFHFTWERKSSPNLPLSFSMVDLSWKKKQTRKTNYAETSRRIYKKSHMSCAFVCAFILVGSLYVRDDGYNADILSSTYMRASETAASSFCFIIHN